MANTWNSSDAMGSKVSKKENLQGLISNLNDND